MVVMERAYDALLCDVDGVVRHWDGTIAGLEHEHGLAAGTFAAVAFAPARLTPAVTGRISDERWRAGVARDLTAHCGSADRAARFVELWSEPVGRRLRSHVPSDGHVAIEAVALPTHLGSFIAYIAFGSLEGYDPLTSEIHQGEQRWPGPRWRRTASCRPTRPSSRSSAFWTSAWPSWRHGTKWHAWSVRTGVR